MQIHRIQEFMYAHPALKREVDKVISPNPFNDVVLLNWVIFLGVLITNAAGNSRQRWYSFLWCCSTNFALVAFLRAAFKARRPFEIDPRLRPVTNRNRTNYGFPSIETHMAVVVNGFVAVRFAEWWACLPLFALAVFIAFTRVYSCARFVHQIGLSFVTGTLGLAGAFAVGQFLNYDPGWKAHWIYLILCAFVLVATVGLSMEEGGYMTSIGRDEYVRVIGGIMNTEPAQVRRKVQRGRCRGEGAEGNGRRGSPKRPAQTEPTGACGAPTPQYQLD